MTLLQRAERVTDLHGLLLFRGARAPVGYVVCPEGQELNGGRYKDRTCDPFDVNEVLYR